jgi:hypothetical protein
MMKILSVLAGLILASITPASANVFILQSPTAQGAAVPVISNVGGSVDYVAGGPVVVADSGQDIALTCACITLTSATVQITAGQFTGDVLNAAPLAGLTATYSYPTLTISGTAQLGAYVSVLNSVTYSSSNADPTNSGANLTRTLTWNVVNGSTPSSSPTSTINISNPFPPPTLTASGSISTFTALGSPVALDGGITVTCTCTTLTSATIDIGTGLLGGDILDTGTLGTLTQAYDTASGTLTLTGTATLAVYQTAFRSITYSSLLTDPTNNGADLTRQITWTAFNNTDSGTLQGVVNVQPQSAPAIALAQNNTVLYTGGGAAVVLNGNLTVTCSCANLTSATLTLSSGHFTGDALNVSASLGITPVFNATTGVLTLTGTTTVANYQTLMRTITYSNSSGDPSNGGLNATRTATWVAFNSTNGSAPISTTIDVFIAGQPSWAMTGAAVALNPATSQAWVSGIGVGPISSQLTVTRATQETCYGGTAPNYVIYAAANVACTTPTGMAVWPAYRNYLISPNDVSAGQWTAYVNPTGTGRSVAVVGNSVLDPTGVTSQAAKVTVARDTTGISTFVTNNQIDAPGGLYSAGLWLQADASDPSSIGKQIQFGFLSSAGYNVHNIVLPATWTWFPFYNLANVTSCSSATQTCQFQVGLTNQAGTGGSANSTLAATFDVWGTELNAGGYVFPTQANSSVTGVDNIAVQAGSALETALTGPASSIIMNSSLGVSSSPTTPVTATLVDSNGVTLLGEASDNTLVTNLGLTARTSNVGVWSGPVVEGYSRDSSGRSLAMNSLIVYHDLQQTVVGKPLYLGSTLGSSNFFTGYLGTMNVFNTRVPDSLLGVTGTGTDYYFAAAGNDSNPCTLAAPCQSITKANSIGMVTNDTMNFNGGDTFTGCLAMIGGVNVNATRTTPLTIQSYGTGQATLTPNCTASLSQTAIMTIRNADGIIVNNLKFVGDAPGNVAYGILLECPDRSMAHGNITIENSFFTGINHAASPNNYSASISAFTGVVSNPYYQCDHLVALNNTDAGATSAATDSVFINQPGYACAHQWDAVQGNLIYNLGGLVNAPTSYFDGSGVVMNGACPAGSLSIIAPGGASANHAAGAGAGAIIQFNVVHDLSANQSACGSSFGLWTNGTDTGIIRLNEVYNMLGTAGCDKGAYDMDGGTTNNIVERNYSHNNFGPCLLFFGGSGGVGNSTNNTARWNICDGDGVHTLQPVNYAGSGQLSYNYNNTVAGSPTAASIVNFTNCATTGSLLANNIIISRSASLQNFFNMGTGTNICQPGPTGGLTITHNDWWPAGTGSFRYAWIDDQGSVGTITGSISGTTLSAASATGVIKNGMMITGTGIPASTYIRTCTAAGVATNGTCTTYPQTMTISQSANVGSEAIAATAAAYTFANQQLLLHETGGLNVNPLFVNPYQNTTCNTTVNSPGPQAGNCPAGMHLQSGSSLHAPAGAVLTSQPFNLPINNGGGTWSPTGSQGTKDYWGNNLPCPTVGGFPIGAEC